MLRLLSRTAPAVAAALLAAGGCWGADRRPIARLTVEPAAVTLDHPQHRSLRFRLLPTTHPLGGGCPTVFVHLVDEGGKVLRTFDHRPPLWEPGEELSYEVKLFQSALSEPLPAGRYDLAAGLYGPQDGRRFGLEVDGPAIGKHRYRVGSVVVARAAGDAAAIEFEGGWEPPEAGTDLQILIRRWFHRRGALMLRGNPAALRLFLLVLVPEPAPPGELTIHDGSSQPWVNATVSCAADPPPLSIGRHELELEIPPQEATGGCEIALEANFTLRAPSFPGPRSAALETVSWVRVEP